jgi:hypothetical protein
MPTRFPDDRRPAGYRDGSSVALAVVTAHECERPTQPPGPSQSGPRALLGFFADPRRRRCRNTPLLAVRRSPRQSTGEAGRVSATCRGATKSAGCGSSRPGCGRSVRVASPPRRRGTWPELSHAPECCIEAGAARGSPPSRLRVQSASHSNVVMVMPEVFSRRSLGRFVGVRVPERWRRRRRWSRT